MGGEAEEGWRQLPGGWGCPVSPWALGVWSNGTSLLCGLLWPLGPHKGLPIPCEALAGCLGAAHETQARQPCWEPCPVGFLGHSAGGARARGGPSVSDPEVSLRADLGAWSCLGPCDSSLSSPCQLAAPMSGSWWLAVWGWGPAPPSELWVSIPEGLRAPGCIPLLLWFLVAGPGAFLLREIVIFLTGTHCLEKDPY